MQKNPKGFGSLEVEMDVSIARDQHHSLITRLMTGPGDSEGAMHRAERMFGLSYWAQFACAIGARHRLHSLSACGKLTSARLNSQSGATSKA